MNINSKQIVPYAMRNHGIWHFFKALFTGRWNQLVTNKALCKSAATILSLSIVSVSSTLLLSFSPSKTLAWLAISFISISLMLLNMLYMRLIEKLFEQLNSR